jgi:hypothetical protein
MSAFGATRRNGAGGVCLLCPGNSDINLFCYGNGIIDLDAKVPDGAFDLCVPEQEPRVLSRRDALSRARAAGEHEFTGLLGGRSYVIVGRLTGLFCQLELDRLPCLFLLDRGPIDCISTRNDILDLEGDNIAATQFAMDSQITHWQVARPALYLQLGPD